MRLLHQAADIVRSGGVIVYPTDSGYALGCHIGDKSALTRIRLLRRLDEKHNFTLVCSDLSDDWDLIEHGCTINAALLGISAKIMVFSGANSGTAYAGMNLVGQGREDAWIWYDIITPPQPLELPDGRDSRSIGDVDRVRAREASSTKRSRR